MMIVAGYTFLSRTPPYDTKHLYIVIAIVDEDNALFVNVTTKKENRDDTCILRENDHDFIKHDSVINYGDAKVAQISKIEEAISKGIFTPQDPISDELLEKIRKGALNSSDLPQKHLKHISETP